VQPRRDTTLDSLRDGTVRLLFLLGRPDWPTDGVEDYSRFLGGALAGRGHTCYLRSELESRRVDWTLLQFTNMMWSRRGFPVGVAAIARVVRPMNSRLAVVIHDPSGFPGTRLRDRTRRGVQRAVMRHLVDVADRVFVTVEPSLVPWTAAARGPMFLLPAGSNIQPVDRGNEARSNDRFRVLVFGVTGGSETEVEDIGSAMQQLARSIGPVSLVVAGRGSSEARSSLSRALRDAPIDVIVTGLLPSDELSSWLRCSNALLFVRGGISSRRATVAAALAHGLPVVGYRGPETGWPITDAGVALVPIGDTEGLALNLIRLATDPDLAAALSKRSVLTYERHLSWNRLAEVAEGHL
jgi:glycosyltransferase involved in cell wall biosynthesis